MFSGEPIRREAGPVPPGDRLFQQNTSMIQTKFSFILLGWLLISDVYFCLIGDVLCFKVTDATLRNHLDDFA